MTDDPKSRPEIQYLPVQYLDHPNNDDEIDLLQLVEEIWKGRKVILISTVLFFIVGFFHYMTGPEEYQSEAILLQEAQQPQMSANMRLLQQFGGGGSVGGSDPGTLSANLYPRIIESVEFQHQLLLNEVEFESLGRRMMLYEYFIEEYKLPFRDRFYRTLRNYTIRLPITLYRNIRGLFSSAEEPPVPDFSIDADGNIMILNPFVRRAISQMRGRISVEFEGGFINVSATMPDPKAAAELNALLIAQIQEYVIDYRSEKARQNLEFTQLQYAEIEARYEEAQRALAQFQDQNRGQMTALARIEQERLQNERSLTFNLYNNFAQILETARLRLQEETPVFSQLQRPNLPHQPVNSSPLIVIAATLLGGFMGVFWIFGSKAFGAVRERIKG